LSAAIPSLRNLVFSVGLLLILISVSPGLIENVSAATATGFLRANVAGAPSAATTFTSTGQSIVGSFTSFGGISETQAVAPPDVQVASSQTYIVEMVNLQASIFNKQGSLVKTMSLSSFFGSGSDSLSDPKVLYDPYSGVSGRWFASILDITTNRVLLAISSSSDPTMTPWPTYNGLISASPYCPDQPILGINDDKIVVAANDLTSCITSQSFVGSQYWVITKNDLVNGAPSPGIQSFGPSASLFSVHPAHSLSPTATEYLVANAVASITNGSPNVYAGYVQIISITGVPPNVPTSPPQQQVSLANPITATVFAYQPGTSNFINTDDFRLQDAAFYNSRIWFAFNDGCTPAGDSMQRSCFRLIQLGTAQSPIAETQDFDVGTNGQYLFYPSLSVDGLGNMDVVYGYSSSSSVTGGTNIYPSVAVTGQGYADPASTLAPPLTVLQGSAPANEACRLYGSVTACRYGDYFGAAVDPGNTNLVWIGGEFYASNTWSTQIVSIRVGIPTIVTVNPSTVVAISQWCDSYTCAHTPQNAFTPDTNNATFHYNPGHAIPYGEGPPWASYSYSASIPSGSFISKVEIGALHAEWGYPKYCYGGSSCKGALVPPVGVLTISLNGLSQTTYLGSSGVPFTYATQYVDATSLSTSWSPILLSQLVAQYGFSNYWKCGLVNNNSNYYCNSYLDWLPLRLTYLTT